MKNVKVKSYLKNKLKELEEEREKLILRADRANHEALIAKDNGDSELANEYYLKQEDAEKALDEVFKKIRNIKGY